MRQSSSFIRDMRKADLRRQLRLVLQDTFLFADTVLENINFHEF